MLQAYFSRGMNDMATSKFFVRRLPDKCNFLIAAGLEQVARYLNELRFDPADIEWLRQQNLFMPAFIDPLDSFRFTENVEAVPERTIFFANELNVRVTAPLREAQLFEFRMINLAAFSTFDCTENNALDHRCVRKAPGRTSESGARMAQKPTYYLHAPVIAKGGMCSATSARRCCLQIKTTYAMERKF